MTESERYDLEHMTDEEWAERQPTGAVIGWAVRIVFWGFVLWGMYQLLAWAINQGGQ